MRIPGPCRSHSICNRSCPGAFPFAPPFAPRLSPGRRMGAAEGAHLLKSNASRPPVRRGQTHVMKSSWEGEAHGTALVPYRISTGCSVASGRVSIRRGTQLHRRRVRGDGRRRVGPSGRLQRRRGPGEGVRMLLAPRRHRLHGDQRHLRRGHPRLRREVPQRPRRAAGHRADRHRRLRRVRLRARDGSALRPLLRRPFARHGAHHRHHRLGDLRLRHRLHARLPGARA